MSWGQYVDRKGENASRGERTTPSTVISAEATGEKGIFGFTFLGISVFNGSHLQLIGREGGGEGGDFGCGEGGEAGLSAGGEISRDGQKCRVLWF